MTAIAIDGDRLVGQRLDDEIGDHAPIIGMHIGTISVENTRHLDIEMVLTVVIEKKRLRTALAFIIAGADTVGVDMAPVVFRLRVQFRVAINLAGRSLKNFGLQPFGQPQHVDGPVDIGLNGLHRVELVVDGGGGTGQIIYFVHLHMQRKGDIVAHHLKMGVVQHRCDMFAGAGKEIIDTEDLIPIVQQSLTEMRAKKAGSACDQYPFFSIILHGSKALKGWKQN